MIALLSSIYASGPLSVSFSLLSGEYNNGAGIITTGYNAVPPPANIGVVTPAPVNLYIGQLKGLFSSDGPGTDFNILETTTPLPAYLNQVNVFWSGGLAFALGRTGDSFFASYGPTGLRFVNGVTYDVRLDFLHV